LKVTNLKVAQQKAREIDALIQRGEYVTLEERRRSRRQTFEAFVDEFEEKFTGWADSTQKSNEAILGRLKLEWGKLLVSRITPRMIQGLLARKLDQDGVTKATANRYLACVKTLFKMAVRWGITGHNPAEKVKMMKEEPKIPEALTEEQIEALLVELPDYARVVAIVAVDTGMRRGELQRLQWRDVDLEKSRITVRTSKNNEFRVIPMTRRVHDTLQEQKQQGIIPYVLVGLDNTPFVDLKKSLHTAAENAGIGHVHLHMLRHTFATRLRERGVPLDRIMELLGQKSMAMVLRYAKATPTQLEAAIEALDQPLPNKEQTEG